MLSKPIPVAGDVPVLSGTEWIALADLLTDSIVLCGHDGCITLVNAALERLLGIPRARLLGQPVRLVINTLVDATGAPITFSHDALPLGLPCTARHAGGACRPVTLSALRVRGEAGTGAGLAITLTVAEAVNPYRTETEHAEALAEAARERAFVNAVFDLLPFPAGIIIPPHDTLRANAATAQLFHDLGAYGWEDISFLHPETRQPIPREQWVSMRALRGEATKNRESIASASDGHEVPLLLNAAPFLLDNGQLAAVVTMQDISVLKTIDRLKDEFLAIVSHDLSNPLATIRIWAETALHGGDASLRTDALRAILSSVAMQQRLISDLMDTSALSAGQLRLTLQREELGALLRYMEIEWHALTQEHGIALRLDIKDTPLYANVDAMRLRQLLTNLLANAVKFTPQGGTITARLSRDGDEVVLTVQDTGDGIRADALPYIFDRFYHIAARTPSSHRGMGLGLYIARSLVELHGGILTVASSGENQGTTFTARLPIGVV